MTTAKKLLKSISAQLNDAELGHGFTTWSQSLLLTWLNEAMCLISTISPQHFVEDQVIKLEQGSRQELGSCSSVRAVIGQSTKDGVVIGDTPAQYNVDLMRRWRMPKCVTPASSKYLITGYGYDIKDAGVLNIYPPVPPGVDVWLKISCNSQPEEVTITSDLDDTCIVITAAVHWVMFRAFLQDTESPTAQRTASVHMSLFFQILKIDMSKALLQSLGFNTLPEKLKELLVQRLV